MEPGSKIIKPPAFTPTEARAASGARRFVRLEQPFRMHRGGVLPRVDIAYETWGELNEDGSNAVLLFTGLSPSAHAASSPEDTSPGWWEDMVGLGRPIDTRNYFVICVNSLGSCFGSTGPASIDPRTGEPYRLSFPVLTIEDVAVAGREVVRHLGIRQLHTVVGPSLGGMSALAFCVLYPDMSRGLVAISSAARATAFAIALRSLQREMIRSDPDWLGGNYPAEKPPLRGMRLARKLGMITYRSAEEWDQRFGRERAGGEHDAGDQFGVDFEVESYLEHHANKFIGQFDPNCYLYLSRAMDLFDVAEHSGCVATELAKPGIKRALVVGVETDFLFPLHEQEQLAECLEREGREVDFVALPSIQGHDSFLVDMDGFRPVIARYFDRA
ncbi:homoserine O-acetyltransferase [Thioalkalivibrio sp. XN279]|uniref:homoserine O-acetyltransferase MetX n=1 Tax=Thioalkalivibrio sp. XN279 TaxID=2714953 RepID=UPI0014083B51|nr:homoserine O-acetyltransferase [Thioalkalivibrio sp. XN279]NHA15621.1 homoserine O-acetyltransferase [Thioalkalivibrio sp. XN279]